MRSHGVLLGPWRKECEVCVVQGSTKVWFLDRSSDVVD